MTLARIKSHKRFLLVDIEFCFGIFSINFAWGGRGEEEADALLHVHAVQACPLAVPVFYIYNTVFRLQN